MTICISVYQLTRWKAEWQNIISTVVYCKISQQQATKFFKT